MAGVVCAVVLDLLGEESVVDDNSNDALVLDIPVDEPLAAVEKPAVDVVELEPSVDVEPIGAIVVLVVEPPAEVVELVVEPTVVVRPPVDLMVDEPLVETAVADPGVEELETIVNKSLGNVRGENKGPPDIVVTSPFMDTRVGMVGERLADVTELRIQVDDSAAEVDKPSVEELDPVLVDPVAAAVDPTVDHVLDPADVMELYPMDVVELGLIVEPEVRVVDNLFGLGKMDLVDEPAGVVDCAVNALAALEVLVKPVVVALNNVVEVDFVVETLANGLELDIGVNKP